jgi:D-3-phosphoglycerate dehydrogenase / 2-oxoglutarate reductase
VSETGSPRPTEHEVFERVGGMDAFEALVDAFYGRVEDDPLLRPMYPEDLEPGKRATSLFLAQYWGGGDLYSRDRGHPRLRMRHAPFPITPEAALRWAELMARRSGAALPLRRRGGAARLRRRATPTLINRLPDEVDQLPPSAEHATSPGLGRFGRWRLSGCRPARSLPGGPVRILVADPLAEAGVAALAAHHEVDVKTGLQGRPPRHRGGLRRDRRPFADHDRCRRLRAATNLKVVARAGVGLDNVDVDAATRHGVVVCNAPQSNIVSAAEHTVALLLSLARNIPQAHAALTAGRWERSTWNGTELHDKVLGVLGLGRIGTLVAQRCHAFGMRLVAYDPFVAPDRAARLGVELVADRRRGARARRLRLRPPAEDPGHRRAARRRPAGPDEADGPAAQRRPRAASSTRGDLADAVRDGVIAGAAIDVFASEPTTESPLFGLPNVIVTPHLGASTEEAQDKAGTQVAEYVNLALAGEFVPSAVNVQGGRSTTWSSPTSRSARSSGRCSPRWLPRTASPVRSRSSTSATSPTRTAGSSGCRCSRACSAVSSEPVTFVNAPLLAEERGLHVREISDPQSEDYVSVLRVSGVGRDGRPSAWPGPCSTRGIGSGSSRCGTPRSTSSRPTTWRSSATTTGRA